MDDKIMEYNNSLSELLAAQLLQYSDETRFLEFKSNYQDVDHIGKYISALSNGACLDNKDFGYLYFGVNDTTHEVKGTKFDQTHTKVGNQDLELYLRQYIAPKINFTIEEFTYANGTRVVAFTIPAAINEPTTYKGKAYIRINSQTTELTPYTDWVRAIYNKHIDWTKVVIPEATIDDIDPIALQMAKDGYRARFPRQAKEMEMWSNETFLDHAKLTINGSLTRAALLLIGKEESAHYLNHIAQIVWRLQTDEETAGDIYTIPFLRSGDALLSRIRNYRFKIYPRNSLVPAEVWKYDTESILEALYNCIAHQDYTCNARIIVTEKKNELIFSNFGSFYDGSYEEYYEGFKIPNSYRNPFLVQAMVNLKMIDTQGFGIHKIFLSQRSRFLPMPTYDMQNREQVVLHIPGSVINQDYSLLLFENADINLTEAYLLDKVQRKEPISDNAKDMLRKRHLVEGRKNALFISNNVAKKTKQKAQYSKNKGLNDQYYRDLIIQSIRDNSTMNKHDIIELLWTKLPEILTDKQKENKITNLLASLRKAGKIKVGKGKLWELA